VKDFLKRFRRNRLALLGALLFVVLVILGILGPTIAPHDYRVQNLDKRLARPDADNWLGTDQFGRDLFSRLIVGTRVSLIIGLLATVLTMVIGTVLGLLSGFFRGRVDSIIMRVTDIMMCTPSLFIMIVIVALFGPSLEKTILVIGLVNWTGAARLVRAETMSIRERGYVEAAMASGASVGRMFKKHVLPNVAAPIIVWATLMLGRAILLEASLSYLGLGAQPPLPSWGNMVSDGQKFLAFAWWQSTFPGLAILITILAVNLTGDGVRDALDPRLLER